MRKIIMYFCGFAIIFFIAPAICTVSAPEDKTQESVASHQTQEIEEGQVEMSAESNVSEGKYSTIKLLHSSTGEVQELNINEYLYE